MLDGLATHCDTDYATSAGFQDTPDYINIERLHLENHPGAAQQLTYVTSGENSGLRTIAITEIVLSP